MFKPRTPFKKIILGLKHVRRAEQKMSLSTIKLENVLVVSKLSRYEFERRKYKNLNDAELEQELRNRGTDFERLIHYHNLHKKFETNVVNSFKELGINVDVVNRFNYTEEKVNWADVVVPTGGDGTFLLAASRIRDNRKPVIGFNSDPNRSEGHLCLHKTYSTNIRKAIERLQEGDFEWLLRGRIRITMICHKGDINPKYLHEIDANCDAINPFRPVKSATDGNVLPVLALNEVFVGETMSARVSHLQMRLNGSSEQTNMKCSGVCICTGTGSTSWHLSINRLPTQSVNELLKIFGVEDSADVAGDLAKKYNKNLIFSADDAQMGYTIRDLISAGVWPQPKGIQSRGFATKIEMKSSCYDASLVVDGGVSFAFNDGTIAFFEIRPEDALRTVVLND